MEILAPRTDSISFSESARMSAPSKVMLPPETLPGDWSRRMTASEVTLLPEPDSPTMATVSPESTEKVTPFTAFTRP